MIKNIVNGESSDSRGILLRLVLFMVLLIALGVLL
jgi:hypothetical protein